MKLRQLLFTVLVGTVVALGANGQRNVTPVVERDPLMEADAKHSLDVAKQGFSPLKKAYKQVIDRFEETFAAYPEFSKMDEFLYIAGMSSLYLADNKGKQKVDFKNEREKVKFAPDKLRADAEVYFKMIVDKYPQSTFLDKAKDGLRQLGARSSN